MSFVRDGVEYEITAPIPHKEGSEKQRKKWRDRYHRTKAKTAAARRNRAIKWARDNPEKVKESAKKSAQKAKEKDPEKVREKWIISTNRRRALKTKNSTREQISSAEAKIRGLLKKESCRCAYCGATFLRGNFEFDHVVPLSKGGAHSADNLVVACRKCNASKGARIAPKITVAE